MKPQTAYTAAAAAAAAAGAVLMVLVMMMMMTMTVMVFAVAGNEKFTHVIRDLLRLKQILSALHLYPRSSPRRHAAYRLCTSSYLGLVETVHRTTGSQTNDHRCSCSASVPYTSEINV